MMVSLKDLEKELKLVKQRNNRVEADKAWETSKIRKMLVGLLTYVVIVVFFKVAGLPKPFINSVIPALAFLLSTLTIPLFKKCWLKNIYQK